VEIVEVVVWVVFCNFVVLLMGLYVARRRERGCRFTTCVVVTILPVIILFVAAGLYNLAIGLERGRGQIAVGIVAGIILLIYFVIVGIVSRRGGPPHAR
jgi:hypothetical protein